MTAVFTALAAALGFALAPVPNVELVTLTVFTAGIALGRLRGAVVGASAMAIYSGFSPNGSGLAIPPLFVGQVLAMALAGALGGVLARYWTGAERPRGWAALAGAATGLVLTLVYQCSVIVGLAISMPQFNQGLWAAIAANAFFSGIHLASNTVIFGVLCPVLLPKLVHGAQGRVSRSTATPLTILALALVLLPANSWAAAVPESPSAFPEGFPAHAALEAPGGDPDRGAPDTSRMTAPAAADTSSMTAPAAADSVGTGRAPGPPREPEGDVRLTRAGGVADVLARRPGVRLTGTGWPGHRASIVRGPLPASLNGLAVDGRSFSGLISCGLDLLSASSVGGDLVYVPEGPDLSLWPSLSAAARAEFSSSGRPVIALERWFSPPSRPFTRLSMLTGADGLRATGAEFGRTYRQGSLGVVGSFEKGSGRGPVPGGSYDRSAEGGAVILGRTADWSLTMGAQRLKLERDVPSGLTEEGATQTESALSMFDADISSPDVRIGIFHDERWLAVRRPGFRRQSLEIARDGVFSNLALSAGPVDSLRLVAAMRSAEGSALSQSERVFEIEGIAGRRLDLTDSWGLALSGGWSQLAGQGYPMAGARATRRHDGGPNAPKVYVDLTLCGRHPTAVERLLAPLSDGEGDPDAVSISGSGSLEPVGAVSLSAGFQGPWHVGTVGVRGEALRLFGPASVWWQEASKADLRNADDEFGAGVALWGTTPDTLRRGLRGAVDLRFLDPEGAVLAREPVGLAKVTAGAWIAHLLFARDYVRARWEITVTHEAGRARGPWEGLLEDQATVVSILLTARADAASVYALLEDVFDAAPSSVPGYPGVGRAFSAGFSWSFWD